ncbi:MAG: helix-turn-helix transcriptional regulator [Acidimicrobiales bacterium]|nr:helix-turn-helix transcriptional regulator [Acidimicrobiales bacterium]MCB9372375.1 helix-turn-helix transcriptional regulator [Microthrixaceae bacterium]
MAAARELYLARGSDRVSLRDVAEEAGVAYGLIHHHFRDKDELIASVVAETVTEFQAAMAGAETPVQMLTTFFENPDMALLVAQLSLRGTPPSWESYPLVDATVALIETWEPDPQRARILAAALLASAGGWTVLGPFLRQAIDLDAIDPDRITTELAQALERLIEYPS